MADGKNAIVIQQTREMLEVLYAGKYKTMEAEDCIEGIRKALRYRPDLIISDIDLPSLSGINMARVLKIMRIDIPVVLTAFSDKQRKPAEALENVVGFIQHTGAPSQENRNRLGTEFEAITRRLNDYKPADVTYEFHFRQHEWASLLSVARKKKILVVEDDDTFRTLVLRRLDQPGNYELFIARDGLEGVLKALLVMPDLILTDIMMPILDGMAMSQLFHILGKPFALVILSAREDEKTRSKAEKAAGILEFLPKSTVSDGDAFLERIDRLLEKAENRGRPAG